MKLKKQPETELEYWAVIETFGGFIWRMNHNLGHGRIEDSDGSIGKDIASAREISQQMVKQIEEKFGVIPPDQCPKKKNPLSDENLPPAPADKIYYWDWYHKMKREAYTQEYNTLLCSACPFSEGLDRFIALGQIPCGVWSGSIYEMRPGWFCTMVKHSARNWNWGILHALIKNQFGQEALDNFRQKKRRLMTNATNNEH